MGKITNYPPSRTSISIKLSAIVLTVVIFEENALVGARAAINGSNK